MFLSQQEMQENVKKCKNFLATLIKLASHNSPSPETAKNVKSLVQDLLVRRQQAALLDLHAFMSSHNMFMSSGRKD